MATGLLFFLGLKAPGLPRRPYMLLINEDERDVENGRQVSPNVSAASQSVSRPLRSPPNISLQLRASWAAPRRTSPPGRASGTKFCSSYRTCGPAAASSCSCWWPSVSGCWGWKGPSTSLCPFITKTSVGATGVETNFACTLKGMHCAKTDFHKNNDIVCNYKYACSKKMKKKIAQ